MTLGHRRPRTWSVRSRGLLAEWTLAGMRLENATAAGKIRGDVGYEGSIAAVDACLRKNAHAPAQTATILGDVTGLIHAAIASREPMIAGNRSRAGRASRADSRRSPKRH